MSQNLRVRLRHEFIPPLHEHLTELQVIFYNAVMYHCDGLRLVKMRMGIAVAGHTVGRPAGVTDAAKSRHGLSVMSHIFQHLQPTHRLRDVDLILSVIDRHSR